MSVHVVSQVQGMKVLSVEIKADRSITVGTKVTQDSTHVNLSGIGAGNRIKHYISYLNLTSISHIMSYNRVS